MVFHSILQTKIYIVNDAWEKRNNLRSNKGIKNVLTNL